MRKARAQWYSVKSELEQELASEELKRGLQDSRRALDEAEAEFRDIASEAARARQAAEAADAAEAAVAASAEPVTAGPSDDAQADADALAFEAAAPAGPATTPGGGQDG